MRIIRATVSTPATRSSTAKKEAIHWEALVAQTRAWPRHRSPGELGWYAGTRATSAMVVNR